MIENSTVGSIMGAPAVGPDGDKIGTVGQVFIEPHTGAPNWATVHTGLFGRHETFVPLDRATWDRESLHVPYDKDTIKDAPRIDTDEALSPESESELYRYYGITPDVGSVEPVDTSDSDGATANASSRGDGTERHPDTDAAPAGAEYSQQSRMQRYEASDADGPTGAHGTATDASADAPRDDDGPKHRA